MIVLDTNVVSETMRDHPDPTVIAALDDLAEPPALTSITAAEIRFGIAVLPGGARKRRLERAVEQLFEAFLPARLLAFDAAASVAFASICARRRKMGHPISRFDAMVAAICSTHGATLFTRNVKDFADTKVDVVNPWTR